jgi:predicted dehydrogenase
VIPSPRLPGRRSLGEFGRGEGQRKGLHLFRAAIIGTGRIGSRLERDALRSKPHTHAGWYAAHPRVTLVAGADADQERLDEFGADWGIAADHLYTDYRTMLARERPDLVSICAWAPERVEMARAAIEAGARGLWLEKAVACSMAEAESLRALAERAGVAIVVNHMRRADPAWRRVAEIVAGEELGRLESVHCLFSGHFLHTGTHAWDLLDEWCGPWASVRCWGDAQAEAQERSSAGAQEDGQAREESVSEKTLVDADSGWAAVLPAPNAESRERASDPSGVAHIRFANGVHAFVSGSRKRYFIFECDLVFTAGRIQIGNDVRRVYRPAASPRYEGFVELAETGEALETAAPPSILHALIDAIDTGRNRLTFLDEARRALHLGIAIACAAETPGAELTPSPSLLDYRVESV